MFETLSYLTKRKRRIAKDFKVKNIIYKKTYIYMELNILFLVFEFACFGKILY